MIGYAKCFHSNKAMYFKVNDHILLKSILKHGKTLAV